MLGVVQFPVYNTKSYLVGSIVKGQAVALGCVEGSETSEKYPVQRCPAAVAMWRGGGRFRVAAPRHLPHCG